MYLGISTLFIPFSLTKDKNSNSEGGGEDLEVAVGTT
jgi:hypothetical protein